MSTAMDMAADRQELMLPPSPAVQGIMRYMIILHVWNNFYVWGKFNSFRRLLYLQNKLFKLMSIVSRAQRVIDS